MNVLQFQTDLTRLGYDPGPLDGDMGPRTRGAAHDIVEDYFPMFAFSGKEVPDALADAVRSLVVSRESSVVPLPPKFIDLSGVAATGWRRGTRKYSQITGVTVHQTGCPLTDIPATEIAYFQAHEAITLKDTPGIMRWAKHRAVDPKTKKPMVDTEGNPVYSSLKAHYGITYSGLILQIHQPTDFGWHAEGQSRANVGIEIAGFFCGVRGVRDTRPSAPDSWKEQFATEAQLESSQELIRYLSRKLQANGSSLKTIDPHRTATKNRRPDPGSQVYKGVIKPLLKELGCTTGKVTGSGLRIPEVWDEDFVGVPY